MSFNQKLLDFACSIGIPDSNQVSFVNRFVIKPIDWLIGQEETSHFISKQILSRILAISTSIFAALTFFYHAIATLAKLPFASLKAAGIKSIPESLSFQAIRDHIQNGGQSLMLTALGTIAGVASPHKLRTLAYPISEKNKTPIFGYHQVSFSIKNPWTISPDLFRQHLLHLYRNQYELCTLREFMEGYQPANGKKLAIITFDDSHESQFRLLNHAPFEIDPDCVIGIFETFKKEHPDFRCTATFFVNTSSDPGTSGKERHQLFSMTAEQDQYFSQKLRYLTENGFEIGAHGHLHQNFRKMSQKEIEEDIQAFDQTINKLKADTKLADLEIVSFAWPHGSIPKKALRKLIDNRFPYVADFGLGSGKESRLQTNPRHIKRLYIGPHTGFQQYAP